MRRKRSEAASSTLDLFKEAGFNAKVVNVEPGITAVIASPPTETVEPDPSRGPPDDLFESHEGEVGMEATSPQTGVQGAPEEPHYAVAKLLDTVVKKTEEVERLTEKLAEVYLEKETVTAKVIYMSDQYSDALVAKAEAANDVDTLGSYLRTAVNGGFTCRWLQRTELGPPIDLVQLSWSRFFPERVEHRPMVFARSAREALVHALRYEQLYEAKGKDEADLYLTAQRIRSEGERVAKAIELEGTPDTRAAAKARSKR